MNNKKSLFQQWLDERSDKLNEIPLKERVMIEQSITKQVLINMEKAKSAGKFFSWDDIMSVPEVDKYFNIITTSGDRNIGKTYSIHEKLSNNWHSDALKFIKIRSSQEEIMKTYRSDNETWWGKEQWYMASQQKGVLQELPEAKNAEIVGYYVPLSTSAKFKSIEFPNVSTIIYDEFNSDVSVADKFNKLATFVITAFRHRKNTKLILMANYVDQNDEILQKFGVGLEELDDGQILIFNWITRAIMWFIPRGYYQQASVGDTIGKGLALVDFDTYKNSYGGKFKGSFKFNIINTINIPDDREFLFNIGTLKGGEFTQVAVFSCKRILYPENMNSNVDISKLPYEQYLVMTENIQQDGDVITFTHDDHIAILGSHYVPYEKMGFLLDMWKNNLIKTDTNYVMQMLRGVFTRASKSKSSAMVGEIGEVK